MFKFVYLVMFVSFAANASILDLSSHETKRLSSLISSEYGKPLAWSSKVTSFTVSPAYREFGQLCRSVVVQKYNKRGEYQACLKEDEWIIL